MNYLKIFLLLVLLILFYQLTVSNYVENFSETNAKNFLQIGHEAGTDKIFHHGYDRYYPMFLNNIRNMEDAMLEIGIDRTHSLKLWLDYFPKAFIYGLDIGVELEQERVKVFKADQSNINDLINVRNIITKPIRFIIDDGSHIPEHQILTFDYFFRNLLQPGGVYIIEDIEVSYWTKNGCYGYASNYGYKNPTSLIEHTKSLVDTINGEFLTDYAKEDNKISLGKISKETSEMISSMTYGQNCIIFVKKIPEEMKYLNRPYRNAANL